MPEVNWRKVMEVLRLTLATLRSGLLREYGLITNENPDPSQNPQFPSHTSTVEK
jgi:hypothetical protein